MSRKTLKPDTRRAPDRNVLSSIDRLPPAAKSAKDMATAQLQEPYMLKEAILAELNARLTELGIKPVSRSAFGRWSVREVRRLQIVDDESRIRTARIDFLKRIEDRIAVACSHFIATVISQSLVNGSDATSIAALSLAFRSAVTTMDIGFIGDSATDLTGRMVPVDSA